MSQVLDLDVLSALLYLLFLFRCPTNCAACVTLDTRSCSHVTGVGLYAITALATAACVSTAWHDEYGCAWHAYVIFRQISSRMMHDNQI